MNDADVSARVRRIEHEWIPLADGCRLAARLWIPRGAPPARVPAVLEYIPYGKRLGTRDRDDALHGWLAAHGIAAARVDLRGSGESDGALLDEYLPREQADGEEVIAWIAAQPWCNGRVGMIGKSWGGFNALQIAARRPPALGGIVSVCSTDDRYGGDVHARGGCVLVGGVWWGAVFLQLLGQPPDPELVGADWRARWRERLETAEPPLARWLRHPLRDAYWKQGSVGEDTGAIRCPVLAVGGWADGYAGAVPRLVAGLSAPCRGLVGPWGHEYPHDARIGASIGFLQEVLAFFQGCLGGGEARVEPAHAAWPAYRVWMGESVAPTSDDGERPGRWVAERAWPSARIVARELRLAPGALGERARPARLMLAAPETTGGASPSWLVAGVQDQREDDERSLCFDTPPLEERLEILGAPELVVVVASDRPIAFLAARLCDVAPDGRSQRVTYGLANLTHAADHESWHPLVPGRSFVARVGLAHAAHAFRAGHRVRLALSNALWPLAWPAPQPVTLTVRTDGSALTLPVRPPDPADRELRPFAPPERAPAARWRIVSEARADRHAGLDPASGDLVRTSRTGFDARGAVALGRLDEADGIVGGDATIRETRIHPRDPARARASCEERTELARGAWRVSIESALGLACTPTDFVVTARLVAREADAVVFRRTWSERIPRVGG